jgi:transcriptional regulator GlxA family with amidase domain
MEQHWDEAVTIETLSQVTGTSPRSLFHLFRKTHGVSPMVHLHRIRLRHAKAMLSQPDAGTSVTKVGFLCGFSNLGHFAMKYQSVFGEKPSETLRNSQR